MFYKNICVLQIAPAAKKLWDKGPGAGGDSKGPPQLPPLQLNPEQMWRDPTWSAQGKHPKNFFVQFFLSYEKKFEFSVLKE